MALGGPNGPHFRSEKRYFKEEKAFGWHFGMPWVLCWPMWAAVLRAFWPHDDDDDDAADDDDSYKNEVLGSKMGGELNPAKWV